MDERSAPCVPIVQETVRQCDGDQGSTPCKSQRWFPTPVADGPACSRELQLLCAVERTKGECQACADVAANWNKLRLVGCTDALVAGLCNSSAHPVVR